MLAVEKPISSPHHSLCGLSCIGTLKVVGIYVLLAKNVIIVDQLCLHVTIVNRM